MSDRPELRASDADRERVVAALRRHHADGRLDDDELEERLGAAWSARYESDLERLLADLPEGHGPPPPVAPPVRSGPYDVLATWRRPEPPDEALASLLDVLAPELLGRGFDLAHRGRLTVVFSRRRFPLWVPVVAILFFPFGLLALLARKEERVVVEAQPEGMQTVLSVYGTAPAGVRRAVAALERGL